MRFADEISHSRGTPKATRSVNQSSHGVESTRCETESQAGGTCVPCPATTTANRTDARRRVAFGVSILAVARGSDYLLIDVSNSYARFGFASKGRVLAPVRVATSELSSCVIAGFVE